MSGFWWLWPRSRLPRFPHASTFTNGEFVAFGQIDWGQTPAGDNAGTLLENHYDSVFAPSEQLEVGIPGPAGFSILFDNPDDVSAYLPAIGMSGPLTTDLLDPASSASGAFGGEVLALVVNVAFSDAGVLAHPSDVPFGDLVFQNLDPSTLASAGRGSDFGPEVAELNGLTVRDLLSQANLLLGGAASPFDLDDIAALVSDVNMTFDSGIVSTFDEFLALPSSTTPAIPEPSTWAMLLIGLAGLGLAGWRASSSGKPVRTENINQQY